MTESGPLGMVDDVGRGGSAPFAQTPGSQIAFSRRFVGDGVDMWLTNTASQSATEVKLGMVQQGLLVFELDTTGRFMSGVVIQRGYGSGGKGSVVADDVMHTHCIVLGVRYADGTSWKSASSPPLSLKGVPFTVNPSTMAPVTDTRCNASSATGDDPNAEWVLSYTNASSKQMISADFARDLHRLAPGQGSSPRFYQWDPHVYHPKCAPLRID